MPQYTGQHFDTTLTTTSRAIDANSRSMLVELQADNAAGKFTQGSFCQVHFQLPSNPNMVRVPATALLPVNRGVQVAVVGDGNKMFFKVVQLGHDFGDSVEVTAGLDPLDRVINSPPEILQAGDTVQVAAANASSPPAGPAAPESAPPPATVPSSGPQGPSASTN